jgi:hypothetical protein
MSDTPETDNASYLIEDCIFPDEREAAVVDVDFARRLERERDKYRSDLVEVIAAVLKRGQRDVTNMTALDRLAQLHAAERERDDARKENAHLCKECSALEDARDENARLCGIAERERDTMREENRKLRELCCELFEAIDEHADYRVQPGGGYTKERMLIEKTDQLLNP